MKKLVAYFFAGIWICFIFYNSLQNAIESSQNSSMFVLLSQKLLHNFNVSIELRALSFIIRKLAHMFEFFLLAVLFFVDFNSVNKKVIKILIISGVIALVDEGIQLFSIGRSSSIYDVFIDIFGSFIGILLCSIIVYLYNYKKKKTTLNID
jgi:VanZ family protein